MAAGSGNGKMLIADWLRKCLNDGHEYLEWIGPDHDHFRIRWKSSAFDLARAYCASRGKDKCDSEKKRTFLAAIKKGRNLRWIRYEDDWQYVQFLDEFNRSLESDDSGFSGSVQPSPSSIPSPGSPWIPVAVTELPCNGRASNSPQQTSPYQQPSTSRQTSTYQQPLASLQTSTDHRTLANSPSPNHILHRQLAIDPSTQAPVLDPTTNVSPFVNSPSNNYLTQPNTSLNNISLGTRYNTTQSASFSTFNGVGTPYFETENRPNFTPSSVNQPTGFNFASGIQTTTTTATAEQQLSNELDWVASLPNNGTTEILQLFEASRRQSQLLNQQQPAGAAPDILQQSMLSSGIDGNIGDNVYQNQSTSPQIVERPALRHNGNTYNTPYSQSDTESYQNEDTDPLPLDTDYRSNRQSITFTVPFAGSYNTTQALSSPAFIAPISAFPTVTHFNNSPVHQLTNASEYMGQPEKPSSEAGMSVGSQSSSERLMTEYGISRELGLRLTGPILPGTGTATRSEASLELNDNMVSKREDEAMSGTRSIAGCSSICLEFESMASSTLREIKENTSEAGSADMEDFQKYLPPPPGVFRYKVEVFSQGVRIAEEKVPYRCKLSASRDSNNVHVFDTIIGLNGEGSLHKLNPETKQMVTSLRKRSEETLPSGILLEADEAGNIYAQRRTKCEVTYIPNWFHYPGPLSLDCIKKGVYTKRTKIFDQDIYRDGVILGREKISPQVRLDFGPATPSNNPSCIYVMITSLMAPGIDQISVYNPDDEDMLSQVSSGIDKMSVSDTGDRS